MVAIGWSGYRFDCLFIAWKATVKGQASLDGKVTLVNYLWNCHLSSNWGGRRCWGGRRVKKWEAVKDPENEESQEWQDRDASQDETKQKEHFLCRNNKVSCFSENWRRSGWRGVMLQKKIGNGKSPIYLSPAADLAGTGLQSFLAWCSAVWYFKCLIFKMYGNHLDANFINWFLLLARSGMCQFQINLSTCLIYFDLDLLIDSTVVVGSDSNNYYD